MGLYSSMNILFTSSGEKNEQKNFYVRQLQIEKVPITITIYGMLNIRLVDSLKV